MRRSLQLFMPHQWNRAIANAERLVGYNGSFLNLQYLLTDEMAQLALNARKLVSRQQHPLFKTARNMLHDRNNVVQTWGLTVLLVSRAANSHLNDQESTAQFDGIFPPQRSLAEIVELICTANLIHKGILDDENISPEKMENSDKWRILDIQRDVSLGNKLGVLGGDFLLANASVALSKLKNTTVVNDVAQGIADMMAGEFYEPTASVEDFKHKLYLTTGSILAHSCRASLRLANHSDDLIESAFNYGKYLSMAFEINRLLKRGNDDSGSSEHEPESNGIAKNTLTDILNHLAHKAVIELNSYCKSDARDSLQNMALALRHLSNDSTD